MTSAIKKFKNFKIMSIFGIGTDIVNVDRIKISLKNKKFLRRVFNEKEVLKCKKIKSSVNCFHGKKVCC